MTRSDLKQCEPWEGVRAFKGLLNALIFSLICWAIIFGLLLWGGPLFVTGGLEVQMDRYRQQTELPWRNPISGGEPNRTYYSEIAGGIVLALITIGLVVGAMLL